MNTQTTDPTFESITDMVAYTMGNINSTRRFVLKSTYVDVYEDPKALAAWELYKQSQEEFAPYPFMDNSVYQTQEALDKAEKLYWATQKKVDARRPKYHKEERFYLEESGEHFWRSAKRIHLSKKLGELVAKSWPKRPRYPRRYEGTGHNPELWSNEMIYCGHFTVAGLVKKLDSTKGSKLSKQIQSAKQQAEERIAKNRRNSARREIRDEVSKLYDMMLKANKLGVAIPDGVEVALADLKLIQDEE